MAVVLPVDEDAHLDCPTRARLEDIPTADIVFKSIFPRLDLKALSSFAKTCTTFRDMVYSYFGTLEVIDVGMYGPKISERALNVLLGENDRCQKLILRNCRSSLIDSVLQPVLEKNPRIRHIDLTNCTSLSNTSLHTLTISCTQLIQVSLNGCVWVTPEAVTNLGIHCMMMEKLDLAGCWNINDDCISTIAATCPGLTDLNLSRIYGLTDKSIKSVARNSLWIKRLSVSDCWRITDESLWMLKEYSKHLKVLHVRGCRSVTLNLLGSLKSRGVMIDRAALTTTVHSRSAPPVQI